MSMTPLGKPVVPLENGIVARSSKTLTETDWNALDSPDLRTECHCERSLFELSTRRVLYSVLSSWESNGTNSGVQIHKPALFMLETCLSSPIVEYKKFSVI